MFSHPKIYLWTAAPSVAARSQKRNGKNISIFTFIVILLILTLGIFYLIEVNSMAVEGYNIKKYKEEIERLKSENQGLEFKSAEMKSISYIEQKAAFLNLTKIDKISFISYGGGALVKGY